MDSEDIHVGLLETMWFMCVFRNLKFWTNTFDGLFDKCSKNKSGAFTYTSDWYISLWIMRVRGVFASHTIAVLSVFFAWMKKFKVKKHM